MASVKPLERIVTARDESSSNGVALPTALPPPPLRKKASRADRACRRRRLSLVHGWGREGDRVSNPARRPRRAQATCGWRSSGAAVTAVAVAWAWAWTPSVWWWPFRPEPPESVELSQVLDFQRHGVTMLRGLLTAELGEPSFAADFHGAVDAAEREFVDHALSLMGCPGMRNATEGAESALLACQARAEQAGEDAPRIPYVQYINLHRHSPRLLAIATSAKLGRAAAALLDVAGVRLYQSTAFIKPPGRRDPRNQETGWHPDLATVPLDTNDFGTFWCPLQPLARGDSVLAFAPGSHRDSAARYWYDRSGRSAGGGRENQTRWLEARHGIAGYDSYAAGDCSFHHGWTSTPRRRTGATAAARAARRARRCRELR